MEAFKLLVVVALLGPFLIACDSSKRVVGDGGGGDLSDGSSVTADYGNADRGPAVDLYPGASCTHPTDCVLRPASCCGDCGAYARGDVVSLLQEQLSEYQDTVCPQGAACPPCYTKPDPALLPDCDASGMCTTLDLYDPDQGYVSEYTACERDEDCTIRTTECCECGASLERLVAIRVDKRADFYNLVCPPGTGCPECAPDYSPFFSWCGADAPGQPKRCRVDLVGP